MEKLSENKKCIGVEYQVRKIVLTSCGVIESKLKEQFYDLLNKDISKIKLLFITIAVDGEKDTDRTWLEEEYATILDLGIKGENITEYQYEENIDFSNYDIIYMIGGNTFYLLKELREKKLAEKIIQAINDGVIYIGSSAGSIILGKTIETALPYDENWVGLEDFTGLNIVDGIIIPHANRKQDFIKEAKKKYSDEIIELYDNYGCVITD